MTQFVIENFTALMLVPDLHLPVDTPLVAVAETSRSW